MSDEQTVEASGVDGSTPTSVLVQISEETVRLYIEQFGRGPTSTRTNFAGPDTVIVTLEGSLTPAERRLADMGEHQRLRDTRLFFQHATEPQFCGMVERTLGRTVRGFVSGIDTKKDISSEVFYLEPVRASVEASPGG